MKVKLLCVILSIHALVFSINAKIDSLQQVIKETEGQEQIDAINFLALIYTNSDLTLAAEYSEQALELSVQSAYQLGEAEANNIKGQIAYLKSEYQLAQEFYLKSLKIFEKINHKRGISKLYNNLGLLFTNLGDFDQAEEYYSYSLEIKQQLNDMKGVASSLVGLGLINWYQRKYVPAMDYYQRSLEILESLDSKKLLSNTYNNMAIVYFNLNDMEKALSYYLKALQIAEEIDHKISIASIYNNLGIVHSEMNRYDEAITWHQKALEIFGHMEDKANIAATCNNLGLAYSSLSELDIALDYHNRALAIRRELNDEAGLANSLSNLGSVYEQKNELDQAISFFGQSLQINEKLNHKWEIVNDLNNLGLINIRIKDYREAEKVLLRARKLLINMELSNAYTQNLYHLSDLYAAKNDYSLALDFLHEHITMKDSLSERRNLEKVNELKIKFDIENKEKENDLLRKNIEIVEIQKQHLVYGLVAAVIIIGLIAFLLVYDRKLNRKLKIMNQELALAKRDAEINGKQILLINKMLRHDISNKLALVISALRLYKKDNDISYLDEATKKCEIGIELIRNLHSMEKADIDFKNRHPINLEDLLNKAIKDNAEIDITYQGSAVVLADESIESVFRNLIENAVKHGNAEKIEITVAEVNNICEIRFYNDGKQINEEIKEKIFEEKFSFGENANTGMGLFLVKQNIQRYGGSIYVENTQPKGVTFFINLKKA